MTSLILLFNNSPIGEFYGGLDDGVIRRNYSLCRIMCIVYLGVICNGGYVMSPKQLDMLVGLVALDIWVYVIYLVMKGGM
jgi:hypothetical protein